MAKRRKPPQRVKPRLSVTVEPEVYDRLKRVQTLLPGATMSGVVSELLGLSLPMIEELGTAINAATNDDGSLDTDRARDALANWAGAQLLDLSDTVSAFGREEAQT